MKNPAIKDPANYLQFFLNPQLGSGEIKETSSYRPLLMASFALNYTIGGLDVFGYHLTNFFLHTLCAFLIFYITLCFLRLSAAEENLDQKRNQLTALFAALVFALHPLQTESVTYITGRSSLLNTFFFLAAFWAYMQYGLTGRIYQVFLSLFCYACALLAKETAVCLFLILILFNLLFPLGRTWKRSFFSLSPYLGVTAAYLIVRVHFFGTLRYNVESVRPLYDNLLTQFRAWVHYIVTLLFPLNLNVDYDFPVSHSLLDGGVILSIFILASLVLVLWKVSKFSRPVVFFALWFGINLLPTNSLVSLEDVITDRWLYLPSVGYAIITALAAQWIFRAKVRGRNRARKIIFFFLCALVVEFYGFATVLRNFTWTSYWTLWEDAVTKSPNKSRPHTALGLALTSVGRTEEAIAEFQKAIQLNPRAGGAYLNLGYIFNKQERYEEAIQAYKKAMAVTPRLAAECHNNLGAAFRLQGRKQEAIDEFGLALQARPGYARPYFELGTIYEKDGEIDKAIDCMEKAAQKEPEFLPIHQALMGLYEKKGWPEKSQEARKNYQKYKALGERIFIGG